MAGGEQQVAIGQDPQLITAWGGVFPFHFAIGIHDEDFALDVVGTSEAMPSGLRNQGESDEPCGSEKHQERTDGAERGHGWLGLLWSWGVGG